MLDNILFSTFYTGLFLLFREKNWGGHGPPRPLPLLRHCDYANLHRKSPMRQRRSVAQLHSNIDACVRCDVPFVVNFIAEADGISQSKVSDNVHSLERTKDELSKQRELLEQKLHDGSLLDPKEERR